MARNHVAIYVWIVDAIERHGRLTLEELNSLWAECPLYNGSTITRRTFFNYRSAIETMFELTIRCNRSTYEYYIDRFQSEGESRMHHWLLDAFSLTGTLSESRDVASRIVLDDVPSARINLPTIIDAMRENKRICFSYRTYKRVNATNGVVIEPYFTKIFKNLWYVIGYNVADGKIKTYALDRMSDLVVTDVKFVMPPNFEASTFFKDCFGIMQSQGEVKNIVLRVNTEQAKYFRALPLHRSQHEEIHDDYSLFSYRMYVTYDLCEHILSFGENVEVVYPPELKVEITNRLTAALEKYRLHKDEKIETGLL